MLEFEPEPTATLKARYPKAIKDIIHPKVVERNPARSPGKKRKHVFDFSDGLRIIISVDQFEGMRRTHYSASMYPNNPFSDVVKFAKFVVDHINDLRETEMTGRLMTTIAKGGILHCMYDESPKAESTKPFVTPGNPQWN